MHTPISHKRMSTVSGLLGLGYVSADNNSWQHTIRIEKNTKIIGKQNMHKQRHSDDFDSKTIQGVVFDGDVCFY